MLIGAGGLIVGCATAPPVDRSYPAAWPKIVALNPKGSERGAELNGTYSNQGVVAIPGRAEEAITLASLIPFQESASPQPIAAVFTKAKEITLRSANPKRDDWVDWLGIEFIADAEDGKEGVWVKGFSVPRAGGFAFSYLLIPLLEGVPMIQYRIGGESVYLTKAVDGSLIAEIQDERIGMSLIIVPYYSKSKIWARFSPRTPSEHPATPSNPPAAPARKH